MFAQLFWQIIYIFLVFNAAVLISCSENEFFLCKWWDLKVIIIKRENISCFLIVYFNIWTAK